MKKALIDFGKPVRAMKPQHGLSHAMSYIAPAIPFLMDELEFSKLFTRVHVSTSGYGKGVNVPYIFRNFSADPADPAAYHFAQTDTPVADAVHWGSEVIYCLSGPREITLPRIYCTVPEDFEKWADICVGIIRHYNKGWANGFHYGIRYWEIWNEPDNPIFWENGTPEQYFQMYACTARKIKALDPSLKVGGPALSLANEQGLDFAKRFLTYVKEQNVPLDFLSWHAVSTDVTQVEYNAARLTGIVRESGLDVEMIQTGWLCAQEHGDERTRFDHCRDNRGMAYAASVLCLMQRYGMAGSLSYDLLPASQYNGIINVHQQIQKPFYALKAFKVLYDLKTEVESHGYGICVIAARHEGRAAILAVNYDSGVHRCELRFQNFGPCRALYYTADETRNLEQTREEFHSTDGVMAFQLRGYSAMLIELETV